MSQDTHLQQSVLAELKWEPSVTAAHIGVTVHQGVVTLSGHVASFPEKQAAEAATRRVKGVKAVVENIEVELPFDGKREDEDIASAALHRLAWDISLPDDAIQVKVEQGWLTLTGEVDWHYQKENADQDVRRLPGVVGVSNQIAIKPSVDVSHVRDDIMHALHRSWFFDPRTISVSAEDGRVRLSGTVSSPHERQVAAATAWAAPGVTDVRDELEIV